MSKEKNTNYEGFTLTLALVDALPVLLFGGSSILIGLIFKSPLFIVGACLTFLAGFLKVMWKVVLAVWKKDVKLLNKQMRIVMPIGFAIMIVSLIVDRARISFPAMLAGIVGFPQVIFFVLWVCGMVGMGVLAKKLDSSVAKNNWIEQSVNGVAQLCLFIALLIIAL